MKLKFSISSTDKVGNVLWDNHDDELLRNLNRLRLRKEKVSSFFFLLSIPKRDLNFHVKAKWDFFMLSCFPQPLNYYFFFSFTKQTEKFISWTSKRIFIFRLHTNEQQSVESDKFCSFYVEIFILFLFTILISVLPIFVLLLGL